MRLGLAAAAAVLLCACQLHLYDPLDELEYRVYPDAASAIRGILADVPPPRVYAVGEYHPTRGGAAAQRAPIARFTDEIIELLEPRAQHLVIEAWAGDGCSGARAESVSAQVARAIGRPAGAASDLARLVTASQRASLVAHTLPITCIEQSAMLDARGRVDFLRLLEMIATKLYETARALAVDQGRAVIVYGGALHNDLYPRYALEELTYAPALARDLGGGGVLEIDLVVPEIVAPLPMVRGEPWFPLLGLASPARAIVWERGPASYVVMLPAQTEGIGRFARPAYARR